MGDCETCRTKDEVRDLRERLAVQVSTSAITEDQVGLIFQKVADIKEAVDKNEGRAGMRDEQLKSILSFAEEVRSKWHYATRQIEEVDRAVKSGLKADVEKTVKKLADVEACLHAMRRKKASDVGWGAWFKQLGRDSFRAAIVNVTWVFALTFLYLMGSKIGAGGIVDRAIRHILGL